MQLNRALKEKRLEYAGRQEKDIFQHNNARPHIAKSVKKTLEVLNEEVLQHLPYLPDITTTDYHYFRSTLSFWRVVQFL